MAGHIGKGTICAGRSQVTQHLHLARQVHSVACLCAFVYFCMLLSSALFSWLLFLLSFSGTVCPQPCHLFLGETAEDRTDKQDKKRRGRCCPALAVTPCSLAATSWWLRAAHHMRTRRPHRYGSWLGKGKQGGRLAKLWLSVFFFSLYLLFLFLF